MRNLLILSLLVFVLVPSVFAQETGKVANVAPGIPAADVKPTPAEKKTPDQVIIPADIAIKLQNSAQRAEIKAQEAEILALRIKEANVELEKLRIEGAKLQEEANAAYSAEAIKAGVPPDQVRDYQGVFNPKGEMVLKRKTPPAPQPSKP
jgi:hypothetical protein